jgi:hypothetical protein
MKLAAQCTNFILWGFRMVNFETTIDQILESWTNGQFTQVWELFRSVSEPKQELLLKTIPNHLTTEQGQDEATHFLRFIARKALNFV